MSTLDVADVQRPLSQSAKSNLDELEVFSSIASTNSHLMEQPSPGVGRFRVAIADHQTSGRGQHYRRWISAPGSGLCLSFSYTFAISPGQLSGLTLAIGVGVIKALLQLGIDDVSLKWPNDIVALDGKLGGILTEVRSGSASGVTVVCGIGLNVHIREKIDLGAELDWALRAVDLKGIMPNPPGRELLAGTIIDQLYATFCKFEESGFAEFANGWQQYDWLRDREITVDMSDDQLTGTAAGVADDGALIVVNNSGSTRIISGSIVAVGPKDAD